MDLAGVRARLAACDARLKGDVGEHRAQLEGINIAAEIELAGCEARRAASTAFVEKVAKHIDLSKRLEQAQAASMKLQRVRNLSAEKLRTIRQEMDAMQIPKLVEDKVIIRPLKWTE
jgi:hypothetical protein